MRNLLTVLSLSSCAVAVDLPFLSYASASSADHVTHFNPTDKVGVLYGALPMDNDKTAIFARKNDEFLGAIHVTGGVKYSTDFVSVDNVAKGFKWASTVPEATLINNSNHTLIYGTEKELVLCGVKMDGKPDCSNVVNVSGGNEATTLKSAVGAVAWAHKNWKSLVVMLVDANCDGTIVTWEESTKKLVKAVTDSVKLIPAGSTCSAISSHYTASDDGKLFESFLFATVVGKDGIASSQYVSATLESGGTESGKPKITSLTVGKEVVPMDIPANALNFIATKIGKKTPELVAFSNLITTSKKAGPTPTLSLVRKLVPDSTNKALTAKYSELLNQLKGGWTPSPVFSKAEKIPGTESQTCLEHQFLDKSGAAVRYHLIVSADGANGNKDLALQIKLSPKSGKGVLLKFTKKAITFTDETGAETPQTATLAVAGPGNSKDNVNIYLLIDRNSVEVFTDGGVLARMVTLEQPLNSICLKNEKSSAEAPHTLHFRSTFSSLKSGNTGNAFLLSSSLVLLISSLLALIM